MEKYLLSVVIPTKNREKYALATVEQILKINDNRIQVVIQDNSDSLALSVELQKYQYDKRLKYNYTKGTISFVENFNIALDLSDGEYVCIIGDDDGLVPQIIDVVSWAKSNNIDAIKPELNVVYFWPNSEVLKNRSDNGNLSISNISIDAKFCNPKYEVEKLLKQGAQHYLNLDMVKLYHGVVKKECLNKIKMETGKFFGGLSPDIYISVALSLTVERMVKLDFPLTISGVCNKSGSSDSATGRHTGKLKDAPHFRGHDKYDWSSYVPGFYSVETIWADSALAAIKDMKMSNLIEKFNVEFLSLNCLIKHPQFKRIIINHYKNLNRYNNFFVLSNLGSYIKYWFVAIIKKIIKISKPKENQELRISNIENIAKANDILQNRLCDMKINTKLIIKSLNNILK